MALSHALAYVKSNTAHITPVKCVTLVGAVIVFLFLLLFRQPLYPAPWFDEGLIVSAAAMLAHHGLYALPDSLGPSIMDPAIHTAGPTVLLPVAALLHFFGGGVIQARLAMLPFAALLLIAYFSLARLLLTPRAAILALILLGIGNREEFASYLFMSRQVLGEVPALGLYLLGLVVWLRTIAHSERPWPGRVVSGLLWGLAMITKPQMLLLAPASLIVLVILGHVYYRILSWHSMIVACALMSTCVLAWYAVQLGVAGPLQFEHNAALLRQGFSASIVVVGPVFWRNALGIIWRSGWWIWGAPGLIWGINTARQRTWTGFIHAAGLALPVVGLLWFAVLSVGWGRYAFYPFVLTPIWTAGFLAEVAQGRFLRNRWLSRRLVGGLVMLYVVGNGLPLARGLLKPVDSGYQAMRIFLDTKVPPDAVIESWEWEMSVDALQPIHHPPTPLIFAYIAQIMGRHPQASARYSPLSGRPQFLLQGAFGAWTGIYRDTLTRDGQLVVSFGNYALYRLRTVSNP